LCPPDRCLAQEWAIYQDRVRDVADNPAVELVKSMPVPQGAIRFLVGP
jgi:hypothetical protein